MKKTISVLFSVLFLIISTFSVSAENSQNIYVTISDGSLKLSYEKIKVSDIDDDNQITINDALYCAHQQKYKGETFGYASSQGPFGLKIDELWGVEQGDSFGYFVNNASAMSLEDELKNGDHVYAFLYTDLTNWSDTYSFFNKNQIKIKTDENVQLTLSDLAFDASWNVVEAPVENAFITINGDKTSIKTDKNGNAVLKFDSAGKYVISASSDSQNLVPPICVIDVSQKSDSTESDSDIATPGDCGVISAMIISLLSLLMISVTIYKVVKIR